MKRLFTIIALGAALAFASAAFAQDKKVEPAPAATQTQAGKVDTQSYLLVDKETGLPLHSETLSQTENGSNVQGYRGIKLVTDLSDIKTTPDPNLFNVPEGYSKIDPEQVRATANAIFSAVTAIVGQALKQAQTSTAPTVSPSPTMSPAR